MFAFLREAPRHRRHTVASPGGSRRHSVRGRAASLFVAGAMGFQILGQAMPAAASTTAPSSPSSAPLDATTATTITLVSGAGITSDGVVDPNVTYAITGGTTGNAVTVAPQASYGTPFPGSRWINTTGSTGCDQACGGPGHPLNTDYSMTFELPPGFSSPSLSIQVYADDAATVYLNGKTNQVGQQPQNKNAKNYNTAGVYSTSAGFKVGTNTLTVSNIDYGGSNGVDFAATVTYTPDTAAPTASPSAPAPNAAGWYTSDVTITWNWADAGQDLPPSSPTNCPTTTTTTGEYAPGHVVTATCTDLAGNVGTASYTLAGGIDTTAPTISGAPDRDANAAGWYNADVTVSFTCSDTGSGLATGSPPADVVLSEGADRSATGTCTDVAGNSASTTVGGINIDETNPTTTADTPSGWSNGAVTVTLSATDPLSGVASTHYSVDGSEGTGSSVQISGEGTHTLSYYSIDNAGNTEATHTVTVDIDLTAPTISHSQSPAANIYGWNNTDVTVTFTCDDTGGSGLASCGPTPQSVSAEGAAQTVTGTAIDNAGNSMTDTTSVSIDKTAPTISGAADRDPNAAGWYKADVTVSFTCSDALSGIASCPSAVTLGEGTDQTVGGTATDTAGNSSSTSVTGINVDKTAPTITAAATTSPNGQDFYTGPVTVHFTCTDAGGSGIPAGTCPADQTLEISGTTGTASSTAESVTDAAGNTSTSNVVTVNIDQTPSTAPILIKAGSGGNGGIAGRIQGPTGPATYTVTLYLTTSCVGNVPGTTIVDLGHADVTVDDTGAAVFAVNIANLPSGDYITATANDGYHLESGYSTCIQVGADNDSWPTALDITSTQGNASNLAAPGFSLDTPAQSRWFRFAVLPGEQVSVKLSSMPGDYDLAVFKDIPQAYASLVSVADLNRLGANFAGQAFSAQAFSAQAFSAQAFSPDAYSAQAFSAQAFSADVFSAQAFSAQAFSGQAFSAQAFSAQAFSGQAFSAQAFSGQAFSAQAFSPQAFSAQAFSDTGYSAQAFSTTGYSAQAFSGQAFSAQAFSSAQVQSLIAVSASPGTSPEQIDANTWNNTGYYYIRVTGKNGVFDPWAPFTLSVTQVGTACDGIGSTFAAPATQPAGGYKTIILTDSSRFADQADVATLDSTLAIFANRSEVTGTIIDVGDPSSPYYTDFQTLNDQADTNYSCPYAKNLVASAFKSIVDSYRPNNPLQYVVLVGGDSVVPFFRHPDEALLAPESGYIPPVADTTASEASLALNYVLSQDAYGADALINQNANVFPVPNLAVGRLVENAAEATTMLNAYLSTTDGVVTTPTSSLVTGYDFLSDAATTVKASLDAGVGSPGDSLIAPNNISPTDPQAWNATQLSSALLGSRHDLVFLAGHFSANSALAADFSTTLNTTELQASSTDLTNSIVFSAGCHSGYNIVNADALQGITQPLDWSEAFAQKGATLIAGTGYQYGDTDFEMYSEQIYAAFAAELLNGTGPVSVGQALVAAKTAYLAQTPTLRGIDTKALLESTLYGLPMLSVDMPNGRTTPPPDPSAIAGLDPVTSGPGAGLGLQSAYLAINDPLTQHTKQLLNPNGTAGPLATWYSGSAGTTSKPFEPTLPLDSTNVSVPGQSLRGVGFWAGTYSDTPGITPLTGAATEDLRGVHTPFQSPVFYPMQLSYPNYFGSISDSNGVTRLLTTPAQHKADATSAATSTLRLYDNLQLKLFYNDSTETRTVDGVTVTPALAAPPTILDVTATPTSSTDFKVDAHVIGDPSAGIQEVWVTYTTGDGSWDSTDLTQDLADSSHWSTTVTVSDVSLASFIVQAVSGVGLVAVADNYGAYYSPVPPIGPDATPTSLQLDPSPASAAYGTTVTFSATLTAANSDNQPITFTLGTTSKTVLTTAGTASASFQLNAQPSTYQLSAHFPGDAMDQPSTDSRLFTVDKLPTSLTLAGPGQTTPGSDSGLVATLIDGNGLPVGLRTVWFVVTGTGGTTGGWTKTVTTDYLGRAALGVIPLPVGTYTVSAYFEGTFTLAGASSTQVSLTDSTYLESSDSVPFTIQQVGTTETLVVTTLGSNPAPQFSDSVTLSTTVSPTVAGTPFSGTVQFSFNGQNVGSPIAVSDSSPTASAVATLDGTLIPAGARAQPYTASVTFTPGAGAGVTGSTTSAAVAVKAEGVTAADQPDGSARIDYDTINGNQFVIAGTAPKLAVVVHQSLAPEASDGEYVDFNALAALAHPVQVTFQLVPANCTTKGNGTTNCDGPIWTSSAVTVTNAPTSTTGNGVASVTVPTSVKLAGAYLVIATVTSGTQYIAPERAVSTLEVSPVGITAISGGGYVSPDATSNGANPIGKFAFDTEKLNKGTLTGTMAYVYQVRMNTTVGNTSNLNLCMTLSATCRDVDVIIRSTSLTNLNGGQKGFTTGTVAVSFVDAWTGQDYTAFDYAGGTFRIDIVDDSQQGTPSQFGFTAYLADGTTPFHQAFIPVSGALAQTGIGDMTNLTTIASGFITSHP